MPKKSKGSKGSTRKAALPKKDTKELNEAVVTLAKRIRRANSLRWVFLRGIVTGVATALGATIIAGLLVWIMYQVISTLEVVPYLNDWIDSTPISELLEQQVNGTSN